MALLEGLIVEWLGSITERLFKELAQKSIDDKNISLLLKKFGLNNLDGSFASIYKYAYVNYFLETQSDGLKELFALKSVTELYKSYYYDNKIIASDFEDSLIDELGYNAHKSESLTKLFYRKKSVNFIAECNKFRNHFEQGVHKSLSPKNITTKNLLNDILKKLEHSENILSSRLSELESKFPQIKLNYKNAFIIHHSKVHFLGLELPTVNKPREVDLISIFEEPDFQSNIRIEGGITQQIDINESKHSKNYAVKLSNLVNVSVESIYEDFLSRTMINHDYWNRFPSKSRHQNFQKKYDKIRSLYQNKEIYIEDLSNPEVQKKLKEKIEELKESKNELSIDSKKITLENLFSYDKKLVIIGDPGAGKSSLIKYTCLKILTDPEHFKNSGFLQEIFPIIIPLKDYNEFKTKLLGGILDFVLALLRSKYQIEISISILTELIQNKRTLVFFDGLDEIFEIEERQGVRNDIQIFSTRYINSVTVVTSRQESYQEVNFNDHDFTLFHVNPFNQKRLDNFVNKWFSADENNNQSEIDYFLKSVDKISPELKFNPLLLTLILIIYKYEKDLPSSKLEIYESCAKTLIERRDEKEKKLGISNKITNKLSLLSELAYWQYNILSKKSNQKITIQSVKKLLSNYLVRKCIIEDHNEAEKNVDIFLEFAKVRSIYFENNFTHKTFLEYLTSYYIYSNFQLKGKINERNEILLQNISNSFWFIVIELFILKVDNESPDSEIIDEILFFLFKNDPANSIKVFLPILPNLNNVKKEIRKNIISLGVKHLLLEQKGFFTSLKNCFHEKKTQKAMEEFFEEMISQDQYSNEIINLLFELHFSVPGGFKSNVILNTIENNYEEKPYRWILYNKTKIESSWENYFILMDTFKNKFKSESIFKNYSSFYSENYIFGCQKFNWIYSSILTEDSYDTFTNNTKQITEKLKINNTSISKSFSKELIILDKLSLELKLKLIKTKKYRNLIKKLLPLKIKSKSNELIKIKKQNSQPFYDDKNKKFHP